MYSYVVEKFCENLIPEHFFKLNFNFEVEDQRRRVEDLIGGD
jgi:hypothetical protein